MTDISTMQELEAALFARQDCAYRAFQCRLMPTVSPRRVIGVRTPRLRALAKQLSGSAFAEAFLQQLPHAYYEEDNLHGFLIARIRSFEQCTAALDRFLPYVDNWATCDQLPVKVLAKRPDETLERVDRWLASKHCYTIRFGIGVLMRLYLDELFDERFLAMVAQTRMPDTEECPASDDDIYYVDMMRAWYFAEALAKQEKAALPYLERQGDEALLDEWTRRKGIQKAIESRRITDDMKEHLRTLR